jgi:hypothetical protein
MRIRRERGETAVRGKVEVLAIRSELVRLVKLSREEGDALEIVAGVRPAEQGVESLESADIIARIPGLIGLIVRSF